MAQRGRLQYEGLALDSFRAQSTQSPGAITTGNQGTFNVTVPGVDPTKGDFVLFVGTNKSIGACDVFGQVTAANTVAVYISNTSGGSITPTASTTYYVYVVRPDLGQFV